jgi:hypothetical protein
MNLQETAHHPLAVDVAVITGNDAPLHAALGWNGPDEAARAGKPPLPSGDDWLNEDQCATRKR